MVQLVTEKNNPFLSRIEITIVCAYVNAHIHMLMIRSQIELGRTLNFAYYTVEIQKLILNLLKLFLE